MSNFKILYSGYQQETDQRDNSVARNTVKRYVDRFKSLRITYDDIGLLSDHELDKLFMEPRPMLAD